MTILFKLRVKIVRLISNYSTKKMPPIAVSLDEGPIKAALKVIYLFFWSP